MGWGNALWIFDGVIEAALETDISDQALDAVVTSLYSQLVNLDWDSQCYSQFVNHPRIKPIIDKIEHKA